MFNEIIFKKHLPILCLAVILAISAFIYFYDLGRESLTTDEYFSLYVARQPLRDIILHHQAQTNPNTIPPLYDIIMHFWLQAFGASESAQRSFSALLGILSVYLLYRFARLLFDTGTGLLSALFGALSYSWFYFFRMNRCYGLFIFLTLLSLYVFFYYIKYQKYRFLPLIITLINVALIYAHYFSFIVIGVEVLVSIFEWKKNKQLTKDIFMMCIWIIIAFAPYCSNLWYDLDKEPVLTGIQPTVSAIKQLLRMILAFFDPFHLRWNPALTVLYLPLSVFGCVKLAKERSEYFQNRLSYLAIVLGIPFTFIYLITHSDRVRYYAPFSFPLLIILAFGIRKMLMLKFNKFYILPLMVLYIASFNSIDFSGFFRNPLYENWKGAAQYIKGIPDYQNKKMVFMFQTRYNPPVFFYYYANSGIASSLVDNIANYKSYGDDFSGLSPEHRVYWMGDVMGISDFFAMLDLFPDDAWIWVFRYRDNFFANDFRKNNGGRYFFHQIVLNKELPQIDFYLIKRIKEGIRPD